MTSPERNQPDADARDLRICRYLDGSLPAEQRAEFEREMLRDPSLHRETAAFAESDRQVADALSALLEPSTEGKVARTRRQGRLGAGVRRFAAVAATLLVAVTAFVMVYTPNVPTGEKLTAEHSERAPGETDLAKGPATEAPADNSLTGRDGRGLETGRPSDPARLAPEGPAIPADTDAFSDADAIAQPRTQSADPAVACGDTPPPPTRDLAERLERERIRCDATSTVHVSREYIGVVDETRGEVYMIQLDRVADDACHTEADL
ncbi:MAG: hypothetical protein ACLFTN_01385 [Phycisphaerae bacterium]